LLCIKYDQNVKAMRDPLKKKFLMILISDKDLFKYKNLNDLLQLKMKILMFMDVDIKY
jgi:hypothetical protein